MNGAEMIAAKRRRQIEHHGWTPDHDAEHVGGELLSASHSYLARAMSLARGAAILPAGQAPPDWPWDEEWWKPSPDPIENLVNAGALIAAEIDRLARVPR